MLGYRNRGTRANIINRWRVRAGLRSAQPGAGPSRLLLCGGAVGGSMAEAELMACYADYRFGELILCKPVMAVIGLRHIRHAVRAEEHTVPEPVTVPMAPGEGGGA